MESRRFYVTTPIYYVNDTPHIGHAYTTVLADVLARYHRLAGDRVFFLTGTDEHGQKVQQAADKHGTTPQAHTDKYSQRFKDAWQGLNISYDKFIRTTDPEHVRFVQRFCQSLWDKGEIYEKEYSGWYSVGEERFFTEQELVDGKDPISGQPVEKIREKNYFFRMSKYQDWLIQYIAENPEFILPDFRRNEVLGFLRQPLQDLCISRPKSRLAWGVTLPFDQDYVAYVWVDALINYLSAVDGMTFADGDPLWPADYHLVGKDILTTHAVYWTTLLKALDLPQPRHILAHGWWLTDNAKMSKTTGNVVDPLAMKATYGADAFRYFLAREMAVGQDASFSEAALVQRINSDLANDLGNGLSRVLKLAATGLDSRLSHAPSLEAEEVGLRLAAVETVATVQEKVQAVRLSHAIEDVLQLSRAVNRYLEIKAPWKLAKQGEAGRAPLNTILYHAAEALRIAFTLLHPVMPVKMEEALAALTLTPATSPLTWGGLPVGQSLSPGINLFPRIEVKVVGDAMPGSGAPPADPFSQVHLKVARVEEVEDHPNADALYVLRLSLGDEARTVCAGLKKHIPPGDLKGRKVVMVYNLKPANLRGVESQGMILAVQDAAGHLIPVDPGQGVPGEDVTARGLAPAPKANLTLKEFEKAPLRVRSGVVRYGDLALITASGEVTAEAPDGAAVK